MPFFEKWFGISQKSITKKQKEASTESWIEPGPSKEESKEKVAIKAFDMVYEYDTSIGEEKFYNFIVYDKPENFKIQTKNWGFNFAIQSTSLEELNSIPQLRNKVNPDAWRSINSLKCTNLKTGEALFTLDNLLPNDWKVLFTPLEEKVPPEYRAELGKEYTASGYINDEQKYLLFQGNLSKAEAMLILLHEAGHVHQNISHLAEKDSALADMLVRIKIRPETIKEDPQRYKQALKKILKLELNAWLFALNTLKPLIDDNSLDKDYVFDLARRSVQSYALTDDNKRLIARFCDFISKREKI